MTENHKNKGFTLIELLIAMAIALILMTGIYTTYRSQQKAYLVQDQVAAMQQSLRAAMYYLEQNIQMVGYDPTGDASATIVTANADNLIFTMDEDESGDIDANTERVGFRLYNAYASGGDGVDDDGLDDDLGLTLYDDSINPVSTQPIAENIEVLNFVYFDGDGGPPAAPSDIRSIEVTLVAKTSDDPGSWTDRDYTNNNTYRNAQGTVLPTTPGDNLRRLALTKRIRCRNLECRDQ